MPPKPQKITKVGTGRGKNLIPRWPSPWFREFGTQQPNTENLRSQRQKQQHGPTKPPGRIMGAKWKPQWKIHRKKRHFAGNVFLPKVHENTRKCRCVLHPKPPKPERNANVQSGILPGMSKPWHAERDRKAACAPHHGTHSNNTQQKTCSNSWTPLS